jgi:manganese/zinc/iron transport system permease protein
LTPQLDVQLVAVVVAVACALPGTFLVLRRMAMMSDAISHAILPGIVVGFFLTESLASPLLLVAAALTGVLTVALVEALERTRLVREDAAIGLVFPVLFSVGVLLIAQYAHDVHLDTDAVLLGELAFVPFDRVAWGETDLGPRALWLMGAILLLNLAFLATFYKELKLATFDPALAAALGFAPGVLHYALMSLVSVTAVGAFDAVGSILVVALMAGPPVTAYLLTDRLAVMMGGSALIGGANALIGYHVAAALDASIAGSMAAVTGGVFGLAVLLAPERGVVARWLRHRRQSERFAVQMLAYDLAKAAPVDDSAVLLARLRQRFGWDERRARSVLRTAVEHGIVHRQDGSFALADDARARLPERDAFATDAPSR